MDNRMTIQTVSKDRDLIVIQRNPTSGSGRGRQEVWTLYKRLQSHGFEVRVYRCRDRLSRFVSRPNHSSRLRCLVAAGGDGTISSLVQRHPEFPIAVLPLGTENLVAKHLGLSRNGNVLAEVIQSGHFLPFDTGLVGSHRFLLMASIGLDAEVVRLLAASRRGNINHLTYLRPVIRAFRKYTFPELRVLNEAGEQLAVGSHVLVSNMAEYGMKIPFCPLANPHDGLLDVRVFLKSGTLRTAFHILRTKLGMRDSSKDIVRFRVPRVSVITADDTVPIQADGDPCGYGGTQFQITEEKMRLIVPPHYRQQSD